MTLVYGIRHTFSVFYPSILADFVWRRGETVTPVYEPVHGSGADDWTPLRAMKTFRLWLFVLAQSLFWGLGGYLILAHQVKFATDVGYSSLLAASVFALFGIFMITGQVGSLISDSIGREITATLATVLVLVAVAALMGAASGGVWLLYAYAILFGLGMGLFSPTVFAGTADAFHGRYFGGISGLLLAGMGVGGVVGPWLGGFLYDRTGSYSLPFIISAACFLVACAGFWIAAPRSFAWADRFLIEDARFQNIYYGASWRIAADFYRKADRSTAFG